MKEISYDGLYDLYIIQNKTIIEIAKILECSDSTVSNYLKKYDIHKPRELTVKKIKNTNLDKYGCEYSFQSTKVKEKN